MKYLSSLILSLMILGLWSCSDSGTPLSCSEELDCAGECGGSAEVDCTGTCNGDAILDGDNCTNISYSATIQPIFSANCGNCHGGSGGLDLDTHAHVMTGGGSGPVIDCDQTAGTCASETSYLWQRINTGAMPPGNNPDLSSEEISLIAQWINEGAQEN